MTPLEYVAEMGDVPGWLEPEDARRIIDLGAGGYLLEVGAYYGRSAILLGFLGALTVVDPFRPIGGLWPGLERGAFEANWLRYHRALPEVVEGPFRALGATESDGGGGTGSKYREALSAALGRSYRLVHLDGSHLPEDVLADLEVAEGLVPPGGVVVAGDFDQGPGRFEVFDRTPRKLYLRRRD